MLAEPAVAERSSPGLRIAFLGRSIEKKGIHLIVEAIARRPDRRWHLAIAGPTGEEAYASRVCALARRLGVEDRIQWLGYVPSRQELLERSDLLAMPSAYEGFGMVAAEAMCAARPVIVPRRSGVADLVSEYEAGVVIEESGVDQLEAALVKLDDSPGTCQAMGRNGFRAASEKLTYGTFAGATAEVYESLT